jgi:hypothetical protein
MGSEDLMASEKFDFGEVLAALEAKRAALDTLIASFRAAISIGALGQTGDVEIAVPTGSISLSGATPTVAVELPQGALLGMSIPNAIKLLLSAARRKMTTREITTGLKEGGVESTSKFFENTVTTALHRLKAVGEVLKFNDGWALAELYPESLRNRLAAQGEQRKPKKATKGRKRSPKSKTARVLTLPPAEEQAVNS